MPGPGIQTRDYRRGRSRARISSFLWPQISPSHSSLRRLTLACAGSFTTTTSNCLKSPRSRRAHSLRFSAPDRAHPGRCQLRVFATSRFGCFDLLRLIHSHLPPPLPLSRHSLYSSLVPLLSSPLVYSNNSNSNTLRVSFPVDRLSNFTTTTLFFSS